MRRFTIVQEIAASEARHWQLYLDPAVEEEQLLVAFRYHSYQLLEGREDDERVIRRTRVIPRIDLPAAVAKLLGPRFAYVEDGAFDKKTKIWRSTITPSTLGDRLSSTSVVHTEAIAGEENRCRRICELTVDARIFGIGGLVETALEKSFRDGWRDAAAFLNRKAAAT